MHAATITDLLRRPKSVLKRADSEDVVLRSGGVIVGRLISEARAASLYDSADLAGYLLANLVDDANERGRLAELLKKRFPWVKFLPEKAREKFTREFIDMLSACVSVGKTARLEEVVYSWRSTALIYADPQLAAELRRPLSGETRRIPRP